MTFPASGLVAVVDRTLGMRQWGFDVGVLFCYRHPCRFGLLYATPRRRRAM